MKILCILTYQSLLDKHQTVIILYDVITCQVFGLPKSVPHKFHDTKRKFHFRKPYFTLLFPGNPGLMGEKVLLFENFGSPLPLLFIDQILHGILINTC